MSTPPGDLHVSRRERNKRDKQKRILDAASALFGAHGYSAVTTEQIAESADIGTGTLFRYFPTKADLLVAVMNRLLELGVTHGLAAAREGGGAVDAILMAVEPLANAAVTQPENTSVYQREALFGAEVPRGSVSLRTAQLREALSEILERTLPGVEQVDIGRVADTIYATMYVELARTTTGRDDPATLPDRLRATVTFLVDTFLARSPRLDSASDAKQGFTP